MVERRLLTRVEVRCGGSFTILVDRGRFPVHLWSKNQGLSRAAEICSHITKEDGDHVANPQSAASVS